MISIHVYGKGQNSIETTIDPVISYSHSLNMISGCVEAIFSTTGSETDAEKFVFNGLGQEVDAKNLYGTTVWSGVVNSVNVRYGTYELEIGPLTDMATSIQGVFTQTIEGQSYTQRTKWHTDKYSRQKYGLLQDIVSLGESAGDEVIRRVVHELDKRSSPQVSEIISGDLEGTYIITFNCVGYYQLLDKIIYNNIVPSELARIKFYEKLNRMFTSSGMNQFLSHYSRLKETMTVNPKYAGGWKVPMREDRNLGIWSIIVKDIEYFTGSNPYIVGIGPGGKFYGHGIYSLNNKIYSRFGTNEIYEENGSLLHPSEIQPGVYIESVSLGNRTTYLCESVDYDMGTNVAEVNKAPRSLRALFAKRGMTRFR